MNSPMDRNLNGRPSPLPPAAEPLPDYDPRVTLAVVDYEIDRRRRSGIVLATEIPKA